MTPHRKSLPSLVTLGAALAATLLPALATPALAGDELSMQDVQALAKQQSWTELLDTADRVKPSARTADWTKLVTAAATHVVEQIDHDSDSGLRAADKLITAIPAAETRYNFLKADKTYTAGKAKALGRVVAACTHDGYGCGRFVDALADGVDRFPTGVARQIALLMTDTAPSQTIRYWALAADDDQDACRDGRLERAVLNVLRGTGGARLADAQRAATTCYATLEIALTSALDAAKPTDPFIANACPVLKTHGTKTVVKKKCP